MKSSDSGCPRLFMRALHAVENDMSYLFCGLEGLCGSEFGIHSCAAITKRRWEDEMAMRAAPP